VQCENFVLNAARQALRARVVPDIGLVSATYALVQLLLQENQGEINERSHKSKPRDHELQSI